MKIAVCAQGQGMEAPVDPRFGRCRYFVIVDTENETVDSKQNSAAGAPGGAGIQAAQFIANQGVDVLLLHRRSRDSRRHHRQLPGW